MTLGSKGYLVAVVLFAAAGPAAARELQLTSGVVRAIDACEKAGSLLRYRMGETWYVVAKTQVLLIEPPCGAESPPPPMRSGASANPTPLVPSETTESADSASGTPDPKQSATQRDPSVTSTTEPSAGMTHPSTSTTSSSEKKVHVQGYTRKDGTYVPSHTRSAPGSGTGRRR